MPAPHHVTIRTATDALCQRLDCTQKVLCSFLGITETALSTSMAKTLAESADNKVGRRLLHLLYVVETLARDESLTPIIMKKAITAPYFRWEDGTFIDVVTALHMDNIPKEFLIPIADAALKQFRKKYEAEKMPIENGLFKAAMGEMRKLA